MIVTEQSHVHYESSSKQLYISALLLSSIDAKHESTILFYKHMSSIADVFDIYTLVLPCNSPTINDYTIDAVES